MRMPALESFDEPGLAQEAVVVTSEEALSRLRSEAWAEGYQTGREEERLAEAGARAENSSSLKAALAALETGLSSAREEIFTATAPLLTAALRQILPGVARESLAPRICEALLPALREAAGAEVTLTLPPASHAAVAALLAGQDLAERELSLLRICEDPGFGPGEARITTGDGGAALNLTRACDEITRIIQAFFTLQQESRDG